MFDLTSALTPKEGRDIEAITNDILEAKRRGMIRHIGLTNHALSVAQDCIDSGLYETLQFPLSYLSGPQELALVEGCRQANMGYIAMKALAGGLILNAAAAAAWMAQFAKSFILDLADPFSGYMKLFSHFLQRSCLTVIQPKTQG